MSAVTLTVFQLEVPPQINSVELLGSWDSFSAPYLLKRDTAKGHGHWRGCPKFGKIVCDGRTVDWDKPRSGLLQQGGRYWYYYRLDDQEEYYDPARPSSFECPLLAGQCVNVLDVPIEVGLYSHINADGTIMMASPDDVYMTLDAEDRYKKLRRVRSSFLARPKSLLNLLKPRSSGILLPTAASTAQHSPLMAHPETVSESVEPTDIITNDVWPLNCATATIPASGGPIMTSIDKPLPNVTATERQIRTKPSLRRITSGLLRRRNKSEPSNLADEAARVVPEPAPPMPPLPLVMPEAVVEPTGDGLVKSLRRTASVRNFARPFQALSRSAIKKGVLRHSKSHAVLHSQDRMQTRDGTVPPMPPASFSVPAMRSFEPSAHVTQSASPATASEMCSPTFSSGTVSDVGFGTPSRLSAQYAISTVHTDGHEKATRGSPRAGQRAVGRSRQDETPRTWEVKLTAARGSGDAAPGTVGIGIGIGDDYDEYDDDDDDNDAFYSIYDTNLSDSDGESDNGNDKPSEADKRERARAIEALRSTLMADTTLVVENNAVGAATLGDLTYLRSAIV